MRFRNHRDAGRSQACTLDYLLLSLLLPPHPLPAPLERTVHDFATRLTRHDSGGDTTGEDTADAQHAVRLTFLSGKQSVGGRGLVVVAVVAVAATASCTSH